MTATERKLLADRVYRFCCDAIGAPEHLQIAEQLLGAQKHVLSLKAATTIRKSIDLYPWSVERNLDLIRRPEVAEWYEWPLPTRAGHGGGDRALTGCLIMPHPDIATMVTIITAWMGEKKIARHSYGVANVDLSDLERNAYHARNGYSDLAEESIERIMEQIGLAVPLGFQDEIAIMFNRSEGAMEGILRDSSAEIPFVLTLLLAKQAHGALVTTKGEHSWHIDLGQPVPESTSEKISSLLSKPDNSPFRRSVGLMGGVRLRWAGL